MGNTILFLKYYRDVNKVNVIVSLIILVWRQNLWTSVISYATIGLLASYLAFNYFHKLEYYFYANAGYSKNQLIVSTWGCNILLSSIIYLLFR